MPPNLEGGAYGSHALLKFRGTPLLVAVGCGLPTPGFTLIADETVAGELFSVLASKAREFCKCYTYFLSPCPFSSILNPELFASPPSKMTQNCILMGEDEWECSRVLAGRPLLGAELLTGDKSPTPLEAGLYHAVNLKKVLDRT